jgi:hypothetical protein
MDMEYIACCLKNFKIEGYRSPVKVMYEGNELFKLMYREDKIFESIPKSYNYIFRLGMDVVDVLYSNYMFFVKMNESIKDKNQRYYIAKNYLENGIIFSNALWFVKDNAVSPYFCSISSSNNIEPELIRSGNSYTNSSARFNKVSFSHEEIKEAMKWYKILDDLIIPVNAADIKASDQMNFSNYIHFEISSFQRAYQLLNSTRTIGFLPSKIASYITVLEGLLAVKGENTHKIAERTSVFIEKDTNKRIKVFRDIVSIYKIRSDYIHGSEIKSTTHQSLPDLCNNLDSIVRRVLIKMFTKHPDLNYRNSNKKNPEIKNFEQVNDYFNELVLLGE